MTKHKVKLVREIEVAAGCVVQHPNSGLFMLVPVPREDGGYSLTVCRWILVAVTHGSPATWSSAFSDTPQEALRHENWELYADSLEEAFERKHRETNMEYADPGGRR